MLPSKFHFIWQRSFRGEDFQKSTYQKQEWSVVAIFVNERDEMSTLYRGPFIDAFYQISVHLGKQFQRRRFFRNQPIRNKNGLWQPCLLTNRDEMSIIYRRPSIDASYQVSVHLAKRFQKRRFREEDFQKSTNQKQEVPVASMFVNISELNEHSLQRTFQRCFLPSFDSFGQAVSEEKIFQKSTNQK